MSEGEITAGEERGMIPLSRLAHAGYCMRRAALLTNEQLWQENADTAKGRAEHERTHTERTERRRGNICFYEYPVFSKALGISGKCDCVEASEEPKGCRIPAASFPVRLYPVEYKHGKLRTEEEYEIQLCAQAMCLEEMYHTKIPEGAIFYITSHRRQEVAFSDTLRGRVQELVCELRQIQESFRIPAAVPGRKCQRCSLRELCNPEWPSSAEAYCNKLRREAKEVDRL